MNESTYKSIELIVDIILTVIIQAQKSTYCVIPWWDVQQQVISNNGDVKNSLELCVMPKGNYGLWEGLLGAGNHLDLNPSWLYIIFINIYKLLSCTVEICVLIACVLH